MKVKEIDTASSSHYLFNSKGSVMGFFGRIFYSQQQREVGKSKYNVHLPRSTLRQILYDEGK